MDAERYAADRFKVSLTGIDHIPAMRKLLSSIPGENQQKLIRNGLRAANDRIRGGHTQYPTEVINREARRRNILYASVYFDVPEFIYVYKIIQKRAVHYDKYGRLMYMRPEKKKVTKVNPADFAPLPRFPEMFPPATNYVSMPEADKVQRVEGWLALYSQTGMATPAAQAVGVPYYQILAWINEREVWRQTMLVANDAAARMLEDVARMRAIQGDSALLKLFLQAENKKFRTGAKRDDEGNVLPEGVTAESVGAALALISKASADREARENEDDSEVWRRLADQTRTAVKVAPISEEQAAAGFIEGDIITIEALPLLVDDELPEDRGNPKDLN